VGLLGRRASRRAEAEALAQVVKLCDEDITLLGEQLRRLDDESEQRPLDEAVRIDYQAALDAYESAQRSVRKVSERDQIAPVIDTLNDGRYALACVQARLAGDPRPDKRVPCFFNSQHGPSVTDVMFTARAGGGTRRVAACAQDAARVEAGEKPVVRTVEIGGQRVAYRDALDASVELDANYHDAAIRAGAYGGFPIFPGGG
jgi:hypothetical protein